MTFDSFAALYFLIVMKNQGLWQGQDVDPHDIFRLLSVFEVFFIMNTCCGELLKAAEIKKPYKTVAIRHCSPYHHIKETFLVRSVRYC
ncbi:hypothetical protein AD951_07080 [Acetobacter malorum]|uniref:Uncharacterized protein n=1 Tax=Acetobacter malorum TaxID=178901 RepID=A0A149UMW5_9PROT|nr:hypothetical protein AD951_07080 [Acetobacter malorum]